MFNTIDIEMVILKVKVMILINSEMYLRFTYSLSSNYFIILCILLLSPYS